MAPLTHIYLASKAAQSKNTNLLFGSVLPDIAWTSLRKIDPERIHNAPGPDMLFSFMEQQYPQMLNLAIGVKLHSNEGGGDFYSHAFDDKYAYRLGRGLLPEVADLLDFDDPDKGFNISHNLIEAALDMHILEDAPDTLELYKHVLQTTDLELTGEILAKYLQLDQKDVAKEVEFFIELFGPESVSSKKAMTENFLMRWVKIAYGKDVDLQETIAIVDKAILLTKESYNPLLNTAIINMQKQFSPLLSKIV